MCRSEERRVGQMAEHNVLVLEMKTVTKSLEDVFLEITQEGGAQ